jgi:hypothetical protein
MLDMLDMLAIGAISVLVAETVFDSAVAECSIIDECSNLGRICMDMEESIDMGDDDVVSMGMSLPEVESIDMPGMLAAAIVDIVLTGSC